MRKKLLIHIVTLISAFTFSLNVNAVPTDISDSPLYLAPPVGVNFMVTLDDSGSMDWEWLPDNLLNTGSKTIRGAANSFNPLAYNPATNYVLPPWPNLSGTGVSSLPLPPFNNAFNDGYASYTGVVTNSSSAGVGAQYAATSTSNLGTQFRFAGRDSDTRAFYAIYDPTATATVCTAPNINSNNSACYVKVTLNDDGTKTFTRYKPACVTGAIPKSDDINCFSTTIAGTPVGVNATTNENDNFAIWYSYYRKRILLAKSAAFRSLSTLPSNTRLGCHVLNGDSVTACAKTISSLKEFSGADQQALFNKMAKVSVGNSTPMKDAFRRVGDHFATSGVNSPWAFVPGTTDAPVLSCRRSFHMALTDGYYNSNSSFSTPVAAADTTPVSLLPDGINSYSGSRAPYAGAGDDTLADIAFYYWKTNLNTTMTPNKVPPSIVVPNSNLTTQFWDPKNDPATWPHLVNYTVALGLFGSIPKSDVNLNKITAGTLNWPTPVDNDQTAVDDLWHAAVNSRGDFFSASRADELVNAFAGIVASISSAKGSGAGISTSGAAAQGDGYAFQTLYNATNWTGEIVAYPISTNGSYGAPAWRTSQAGKIPAYTSRVVQTLAQTPTTPTTYTLVDFAFANLTPTQQSQFLGPNIAPGLTTIADLLSPTGQAANAGQKLVDYLKGDASLERSTSGGAFRKRDFPLGDILGSGVLYVAARDFGWETLPTANGGGTTYTNYLTTKASQPKILIAGANDGMLHFFNANDGTEFYNFIPPTNISRLYQLALPNYQHKFFVDGELTESDVYTGGSWRTIVTGSTGLGGTGVFAFDVTNRAAPKLLWYIDASTNAGAAPYSDLGYDIKKVPVVRFNNNNWVAVFGNGYESSTGRASLFTVPITGVPAGSTIPTPVTWAVPTNVVGSNGLSTPSASKSLNRIYAGDLRGNMWRFEKPTSGTIPIISFGGKALFTAKNSTGQVQPITARPDLLNPKQGGLMVVFGTGSLYTKNDLSNKDIQTFYSVWDTDTTAGLPFTRSNLTQQIITNEVVTGSRTDRVTTNNVFNLSTQKGWYLDLIVSGKPALGERVITTPLIAFGKTIFATFIPTTTDPSCEGGSKSFLMALNSFTGELGTDRTVDTNGDGIIDSSDIVTAGFSIPGTVGNPSGQVVIKSPSPGDLGPACVAGVPCCSGTQTCSAKVAQGGGGGVGGAMCSATHALSFQNGELFCVPKDSCGKGLVSVRVSQVGSSNTTNGCFESKYKDPRMSWREVQ
jgi:type IV pilus assembly protein PilY1